MDKKLYRVCLALLLASIAAIPGVGRAEAGMGPGDMQEGMGDSAAMISHHGPMHKDDVAGREWRSALTEEQKAEIDWISLRLFQKQQLLGAQIDVKEAELNQLIVDEDVTQDQWHTKLDELLQLKREYMMNKYQRLIEVRQVLTPQQRVSFDLDILSRR